MEGAMPIKALDSALTVLRCFDVLCPEWGVTELSIHTGLDKSHVSKILREFAHSKFLIRDPDTRRYRVGPTAMTVGAGYLAGSILVRNGTQHLRQLALRTGLTATLNVVDGDAILYLIAFEGVRAVKGNWPVGAQLPYHATAAGKIFSAFSPTPSVRKLLKRRRLPMITSASIRDPRQFAKEVAEIKRSGYAQTYGESTPGIGAVAVPVLGSDLRLVAAISVLFPLGLDIGSREPGLLKSLHRTAAQFSKQMGAERYSIYHA
jgi:DNA-binding IclR family transcriptional regulator